MTKKTDLNITGMHCASCSTLINRSLSKTEGVTEANVNYATAKARVVFDDKKLSEADLIKIIQPAVMMQKLQIMLQTSKIEKNLRVKKYRQ